MKNSTIEAVIKVLQNTVKESDEMFANPEITHARTVGFLQGSINGTISFLQEALAKQETLAMIERLEDEDFNRRGLGL